MARTKAETPGDGVATGLSAERQQALRRLSAMIVNGGYTQRQMQEACRVAPKTVQDARAIARRQEGITAEQLGEQLWAERKAAFAKRYKRRSEIEDAKRQAKRKLELAQRSAWIASIPQVKGWQLPQQSPLGYVVGCGYSGDSGMRVHSLRMPRGRQ